MDRKPLPSGGPQGRSGPLIALTVAGLSLAATVGVAMLHATSPASAATKTVTRIYGDSRIQTAVAVADNTFASQSAKSAVLANASSFADAIAGTPLAALTRGPLLLTPAESLDSGVGDEIQKLVPTGDVVYLLGGGFALSDNVANQVQNLGYTVVRYAGKNRFETATIIADRGLGNPSTVIEATGLDFADALAGGAAAAANSAAVLLTDGSEQAPETAGYLNAHGADTRFTLGGQAASADPVATAIVGADRFETSTLAATKFFSNPTVVGVSSGATFPDALAGGVNIARQHGPMILAPRSGPLPTSVLNYLQNGSNTFTGAVAYGGGFVLGDDVVNEVQAAISGQPQPTTTTSAPTTTASAPTTTPATTAPPTTAPAGGLCGAPSNPWGYNFCKRGSFITNPDPNTCNYFSCIQSFWSGRGYMVQCVDGMYSMSGGVQGSCSNHQGENQPVYSGP